MGCERPTRKLKTFEDPRPLYGQDPHITPYQGGYLLIQAEDEERITLTKLPSLVNLSQYSPQESHVVHDAPDEHQVWAPELHYFSGRWQIHYSFSDGNNATHRTHTLTSLSDSPFGPYQRDQVGPDLWGIDQTVFRYNGLTYSVWSGREEETQEFPQNLYISLRGSKTRTLLSEPTYSWEGQNINEAPQAYIRANQLSLFFSANASWLPSYATGVLRLSGPDPLDIDCWKKHPEPLALNTGHGHVVDGTDTFVYHTKLSAFPGWTDRTITSTPLDAILL